MTTPFSDCTIFVTGVSVHIRMPSFAADDTIRTISELPLVRSNDRRQSTVSTHVLRSFFDT